MIASQKPLLPLPVGAHSPLTFRLACAQSLESVAEKFPNVKMPEAMQWLDTGEFLTEESFFRYRDETVESGEGGMVYVSAATILIVDLSVRSGFLPDLNESAVLSYAGALDAAGPRRLGERQTIAPLSPCLNPICSKRHCRDVLWPLFVIASLRV